MYLLYSVMLVSAVQQSESVVYICISLLFWISFLFRVSLVVQMVKNLPAMQETWVQSLSQEDPLEKDMATLSIILAWRIQWTEKPGRLQTMGSQRVRHDWATNTHFSSVWRPGVHLLRGPVSLATHVDTILHHLILITMDKSSLSLMFWVPLFFFSKYQP